MKLDNKGFTLVEVLAVVVILSILGGIAINGVLSSINSSKEASYSLLVNNIKSASRSMYEEVENKKILSSDIDLYNYDLEGNVLDSVVISDSSITTNLQSLVNNGFLTSVSNKCVDLNCPNQNSKLILNPRNNEDIGSCTIKISKVGVSYSVVSIDTTNDNCPTTLDYAS